MIVRNLGRNGPLTSSFGLGCVGMSGAYGPASEEESIATIHAALDAGISLIDTGDFYGMGHNELLIRRALSERRREDATLSVKFGALRGPSGEWGPVDTRPAAVRNFLAYSLTRLGTDYVDVYRPARLDPAVPIEETVDAIADQVKAGKVRAIGLSEVSADTIRRAAAVHPICDVQVEYSLFSRDIEDEILPTCRELGIAVTAYGVLSRGLISGEWTRERSVSVPALGNALPRFAPENIDRNLALVEALRTVAANMNCTIAQVAIAWVAAQGDDIVPLVGTKRRDRLEEALKAASIQLSEDDLASIEAAIPKGAAVGDRYSAALMRQIDGGENHRHRS
ncbi:aldo/keto reductase [Paraburkholderia sp.]|uniref:aldo/keto reductase n=1 Tax=Paraburkholderia sp. TaxID=1926495 RepID=UPI0039E5D194